MTCISGSIGCDREVDFVNLNSFFDSTKNDIESQLKATVERHEENEKLTYFLNHGKRLRSLLSVLVFRACGGRDEDYEDALQLAVAIELQHSASLVHDDIIDGDIKRRSKSSYHRIFGIGDAILTGHRAIVLGFKNVLAHDPCVLETFFDVWDRSLKGEIQEIEIRRHHVTPQNPFVNMYFEVLVNKTASLFAGASKIGSQVARAPKKLQDLFWEYGKNIGIAYQLADDSVDFDKGNEGMLSASWIASRLDSTASKSFVRSLEEGVSPSNAMAQLKLSAGAIFEKEIRKTQLAAELLARNRLIPENQFTPLLLDAPRYMVERCMTG